MRGNLVQRALDLGAVVDAAAPDAEAFEEFLPEGVGAEKAVHVGAEHLAVGRGRAVLDAVDDRGRAQAVGAGGAAEMDLVAGQRRVEMRRSAR